jgi:hypothetical protein
MMRSIRRVFRQPESHVYTAIKDFFNPDVNPPMSLAELAALTNGAQHYVSSTGKTYFYWLTFDRLFTTKDEMPDVTIADFNHHITAILRNLYPMLPENDINGRLVCIFYGVGNQITENDVIALCNMMEIENGICYFRYHNLATNRDDRINLYLSDPLSKHKTLLQYLFASMQGSERERNEAIQNVIRRMDRLGMYQKYELESHYPVPIFVRQQSSRFVENRREQTMEPPTPRIAPPTSRVPPPASRVAPPTEIPDKCPICYEHMQNNPDHPDIVYTSCQHVFHKDCLTVWCNRNKTCPLCREPLPNECVFNDIDQ